MTKFLLPFAILVVFSMPAGANGTTVCGIANIKTKCHTLRIKPHPQTGRTAPEHHTTPSRDADANATAPGATKQNAKAPKKRKDKRGDRSAGVAAAQQ